MRYLLKALIPCKISHTQMLLCKVSAAHQEQLGVSVVLKDTSAHCGRVGDRTRHLLITRRLLCLLRHATHPVVHESHLQNTFCNIRNGA